MLGDAHSSRSEIGTARSGGLVRLRLLAAVNAASISTWLRVITGKIERRVRNGLCSRWAETRSAPPTWDGKGLEEVSCRRLTAAKATYRHVLMPATLHDHRPINHHGYLHRSTHWRLEAGHNSLSSRDQGHRQKGRAHSSKGWELAKPIYREAQLERSFPAPRRSTGVLWGTLHHRQLRALESKHAFDCL